MSRSSRKNPASFSVSFENACLMRRICFLSLSILIPFFLFACVPADPEYRQRVLENFKDTGFISREFFQILIKVPLPAKDAGIKELRTQCRKIAETKRDEIAVSILLREIRSNERIYGGAIPADLSSSSAPALPSQITSTTTASTAPGSIAVSGSATNTTGTNQAANQNTASGAATASTSLIPDPKVTEKDKEKAKLLAQDVLVYRGAFAWFLNSMFLFREDYTDPANCTFIYRNIQKDLYANVIRKGLKPISKEEVSEAP
ncbi:hypothetical protein CH367_04190 [Leptospira barantonii]|uniref:Lipoprotein n=2 Tax=Leptospira barantonii TaxID=2023184 RepID=A0ABX4NTP2_9LEPT|nr:hypothetical protein [Leptospira barantonii]PJZ59226.1 hypothetical protein CH367_04190 [Leptospira barantonii]